MSRPTEQQIIESMRPQRYLHGDFTTEPDPQWRPTAADRHWASVQYEASKPSPFADRYDDRCPL